VTALQWDLTGARLYETGVDHGVLYKQDVSGDYTTGFAWNGLTTVTESPTGAEATPTYADNIQYLNLISLERFAATVEAYTYPDEFAECDGSAQPQIGVYVGQQTRKTFGLSYRTLLGNDVDGTDFGYKLHLVYGATAAPSEKAFASVNDSPEAITFSWELSTIPVPVTDLKPTAYICIDSTKVNASALAALELLLYGTVGVDPQLPLPDAVLALFDGTFTEVTPSVPSYNSTTDLITIPSVTGVEYRINGVAVTGTVAITENTIVTAHLLPGYVWAPNIVDEWLIVFA
jgi:hypothetical protein